MDPFGFSSFSTPSPPKASTTTSVKQERSLASSSSTFKASPLPKVPLHFLPCSIDFTGEAPISVFFHPVAGKPPRDENGPSAASLLPADPNRAPPLPAASPGIMTAQFRGRQLYGQKLMCCGGDLELLLAEREGRGVQRVAVRTTTPRGGKRRRKEKEEGGEGGRRPEARGITTSGGDGKENAEQEEEEEDAFICHGAINFVGKVDTINHWKHEELPTPSDDFYQWLYYGKLLAAVSSAALLYTYSVLFLCNRT
eukprot:GHVS01034302.1.p1 GENE.GHVS01034302.1~~GHVS01034302.1.p1  ORF type:complete len:254 (+),score=70.70 GHVS01034302.1:187-948(+)